MQTKVCRFSVCLRRNKRKLSVCKRTQLTCPSMPLARSDNWRSFLWSIKPLRYVTTKSTLIIFVYILKQCSPSTSPSYLYSCFPPTPPPHLWNKHTLTAKFLYQKQITTFDHIYDTYFSRPLSAEPLFFFLTPDNILRVGEKNGVFPTKLKYEIHPTGFVFKPFKRLAFYRCCS